MDIITDPLEEGVRADLGHDVEIAVRCAVPSGAALPRDPDARSAVDARRDVDLDRLALLQDAGPRAVAAPFRAERPLAAAPPAGRGESQHAGDMADAAGAGAIGAGTPGARGHGPRTMTARAGRLDLEGDLDGLSLQGVEEVDRDRLGDVRALAGRGPLLRLGRVPAEDLREEAGEPLAGASQVAEVELHAGTRAGR